MHITEVRKLFREKFAVEGTEEGNAIWVDGLWKATGKLVRLVVVHNGHGEVLRFSIYPWHAEFDIPGTEKNLVEVLDRYL